MTSPPPPSRTPPKSHPLTRLLFFVAGLILTAIGVINVFIPGPPTTIFLILAAACFARSSPKLEAWLVNHPRFGPSIVAWRKTGAIPRKIKYIAIGSMAVSFVIVLLIHLALLWTWLIGLMLLACALFVATRPEGPREAG
jgi:uncharacterized membrane protein YbaN (DUF454 family)